MHIITLKIRHWLSKLKLVKLGLAYQIRIRYGFFLSHAPFETKIVRQIVKNTEDIHSFAMQQFRTKYNFPQKRRTAPMPCNNSEIEK